MPVDSRPNPEMTPKMNSLVIEKEFNPKYQLSLVEQITDFLTEAIVEGRLACGQRLVENELQRKFGVSRAPIRESFRILEKNGLIISVPRKGTYVRKISQKDLEENFPVRALLEGLAARLAVSHIGPEDIESLKSALSKMAEAAGENDFGSYFKYHMEFHNIFISASKNDTLIGILENLRREILCFWLSYFSLRVFSVFPVSEYLINVHKEILDLFIKKDCDQVETLVKEHILSGYKRFLELRIDFDLHS